MSRIEKEINVILLIKKGKKYRYFLFHFLIILDPEHIL